MRALFSHTNTAHAFPRGFFRYFPPPKFLAMPAVGLDISDTAVRVIEFTEHRGHLSVGCFGSRPLPRGTVNGGHVDNKDELARAIRSLQTELNLQFVRASIPDEKAYLFKTQVPKMPVRELREAIELRLEENVPLPPAEAVFEFTVIETHEAESAHQDVAVTVVPEKVVNTYIEVLQKGGVVPLSFETSAQAVSRAVVAPHGRAPALVVSIGTERTSIFVVKDGVVEFTSTAPIGGALITTAIMKRLGVDADEAEKIKAAQGFVKTKANAEFFFSLMNTLSALKDEVGKVASYWRTHGGDTGEGELIPKAILVGRDANLVGLSEYLAELLEMQVAVGSVWENAFSFGAYIPPISHLESLEYASAVGLALPREWDFE